MDLKLRSATMGDAERLFAWRNDEVTRLSSVNTDLVSWDEHVRWLEGSLANPERQLYVVEENAVPVGTVRADISTDGVELSWTVSPTARGRGIGRVMVALAAEHFSGRRIVARVYQHNVASLKIVRSLGFHQSAEEGDLITWLLD